MKKFLILLIFIVLIFASAETYTPDSLSYLYGGNSVSYTKSIADAKGDLNIVCPDYFNVDSSGNLLITPSNKIDTDFISKLQSTGMKVTPFISNNWDKNIGIAAMANRATLALQLADAVVKYNLDGIDIDIENLDETYRDEYTDFVKTLRSLLPYNKTLSVAVAPNPFNASIGWQGSYDYKALSGYSDYLMIMSYDEHYQGGTAGPVSSASFFEGSIKYAINKGVPASKIIIGVPFYGRFWKTGDSYGGYGIAVSDVVHLISAYKSTVSYDTSQQTAKAVVTISTTDAKPKLWGGRVLDSGTYNIWYDNIDAIRYKLGLVKNYKIKGIGSWALGQEDVSVWNEFTSILPGIAGTPIVVEKPNVADIADKLKDSGRTITANTQITRGEAAVVIAKTLGLTPLQGYDFPDTSTYWGSGEIGALRSRAILAGDETGLYKPNEYLTREQLSKIVDYIAVLPNTINYYSVPLKDINPSRWSFNFVSHLYYFQIIKGYTDHTFRPNSPVTASELSLFIQRMQQYPLNPDRHVAAIITTTNPNQKSNDNEPTQPIIIEKEEPILDPR